MSVAPKVARASGRRKAPPKPKEKFAGPGVSPFVGVDGTSKWSAFYARMSKKKQKGGGASRRGSHRMADAGGCEVRWYWAYFAKVQPAKGNFYMDYGTLIHTCLAYHYAERMERKPEWFIEQPHVQNQMVLDAEGNPSWLRNADELMDAYRRHYDADPWVPMYNEEEFEATIEQIDPDGEDEPPIEIEFTGFCQGVNELDNYSPCTNLDAEGNHIAHQVPRMLRLPNLNSEIVTCRPDLIVQKNGRLYIIDHKTQGGKRDGSGRLPIIDERYPDYTYYWQAMVNLHIVRKGRCAVAPGEQLSIQGFEFNRLKRDIPYDFSRDPFPIPGRQYAKVPASMRAAIRRERQLAVKSATNPKALIAHPWECEAKWKCSYARVCHVDTIEERNIILATEFLQA